jgi:nitroimidazol reductase NimA-like FMN-containing flavoprotein (pyridoxamine 5'-phosphate oxidase superfamily)
MTAAPSRRTRVKRLPERGSYDRATIDAILDEGFVCHLGFVHDGYPVVIPTAYARSGDTIYVHGSAGSRMLRELAKEIDVCLTVTLVDGLVRARSAVHQSINYRSVVVFGRARPVEDQAERTAGFEAVVEHLVPGRWDDTRLPNEKELATTRLLALSLEEASAKVRSGPPVDDDEDYDLHHWAGVIPLQLTVRPPVPDPREDGSVAAPRYVSSYRRPSQA